MPFYMNDNEPDNNENTTPENDSPSEMQENANPEFPSDGEYHIPGSNSPKPPKKNKAPIIILAIFVGYLMIMGIVAMVIFGGKINGKKTTDDKPEITQTEEKPNKDNPAINMTTDENGNSHIQNEDYDGKVLKASEIYYNNVDSIVFIETTLYNGTATGSGFVIDSKNGYIITNYHVVENAQEITVELYNKDRYDATLVGGDTINDIAVLKIGATSLKSVTTGNSDSVNVGDDIIVIGNPLGELKYTLTKGVVSAHGRSVDTGGDYAINMFQIDAAANSGNSGGPAFDATGAVVGIVSAKYASVGVEGIVFCIPINDALAVAKDLVDYGYVKGRPNFGITVSTSNGYIVKRDQYGKQTAVEVPRGAYVEKVSKGTCAEKAGLKVGDIIVELNGKVISSSTELINAKSAYKAGDTVEMKIYRNEEYKTLRIVFDEYKPEK